MRLPGIGRRREEEASGPGDPGVPVLIDSDLMDDHFRRVCAVFSDGRCVIAEGYELDPQLRTSLQRLKREGAIGERLSEEKASLEAVAGHWEAVETGVGGEGDSRLSLRLKRLVEAAAAARASDLVLEVEGGACRVSVIANDRKRPLGERLTEAQGRELAGFLFHSKEEGTGQTSYQRQAFQGFSVRNGEGVSLPQGVSGLRCQRGPHEPEGDHMIARIFYRDQLKKGTTVRSLGFSAEDDAMFAELRSSMSGGIVLGGSTGDGKSTTLAVNLTLQQEEHEGELNLVTVEDPVEYALPGAIQIAVPTTGAGEDRGEHFKRALMHFVRVHPAVGMVSEIRDGDAAREVLQFIATGHQVWTTIHVADANGILFRLLDMGVRASEICRPDLIKLLMKQTLLSVLCEGCRTDTVPDGVPAWLRERLSGFDRVRYRNPEGCERCRRDGDSEIAAAVWRGYGARTAVCETIRPDPEYLGFVRAEDAAGARDYWIGKLGGVPIGARIWDAVIRGECDPRDALEKGASPELIGVEFPGTPRSAAA